ncbi:MAG: hypothetical protein IH602_23590 [Bryobacteraceae bacterium]|nr:hypothetical protein [Bryobacteraceae bacterium]
MKPGILLTLPILLAGGALCLRQAAAGGAGQSGGPAQAQKPDPAAAKLTAAINSDPILRAAAEELGRARDLRLMSDPPYYVEISVEDARTMAIAASFGAIFDLRENRFRPLRVGVRVGRPDFDNTGSIYSDFYAGTRYDTGLLPLDDHLLNLRAAMWLSLDRAYKTAVEAIGRKTASLRGVTVQDRLPDFSGAPRTILIEQVKQPPADKDLWSRRVRELSALFSASPENTGGLVEFQVSQGTFYYANSEGSWVRVGDQIAYLHARGSRQAQDGFMVYDGATLVALSPSGLPGDQALNAHVRAVAANLDRLAEAPRGETYVGPVLFEPQAAAQLFGEIVGAHLSVVRRPVAEPGRSVPFGGSDYEARLGSRVLPEWMDLIDDPSATVHDGQPLAGQYKVDMQGVTPRTLNVVEKGVLKTLLTTRQPVRGVLASTGRARLPGAFGVRQPRISNLFVKAAESEALSALKTRMIEMIKQQGKPYGIIVRKMDFPSHGSIDDLRRLSQRTASGGGGRPVSNPVLVYQVYPDGTEKLVRGLRFRNLGTRSFRDIMAASRETAVFSYVDNGMPLALSGAGSSVVGCSVAAPGVLFEDLELEPARDDAPKLPVVPPPSAP